MISVSSTIGVPETSAFLGESSCICMAEGGGLTSASCERLPSGEGVDELMGSTGSSASSETMMVVVKVMMGWWRRLRKVNREFWKEELGAGLVGVGGGDEGEVEEMGMIRGEGDGRA